MKIIEPSATIIESDLAGLSVCQRIDRLAAVCYQRPPRPTAAEAEAFCRHLIERGHLPALEMAVVHLVLPVRHYDDMMLEKYLRVGFNLAGNRVVASGSIRAFMEAEYLAGDVRDFLADNVRVPKCFQRVQDVPEAWALTITPRFATPEEIPWQHKHVAVRVVCSRAISHQLVRHRPCSFLQESASYCRYDDGVTFIRPEWATMSDMFEAQCHQSEQMYRIRRDMGLSPQQARGALIHDVKTELIIYASLPEWRHIFKMRCGAGADPEARRIMVPLREQFKAEYPEMWEGK